MSIPHGGQIVKQVITDPEEIEFLRDRTKKSLSITLDEEQIKEVKNIARGLYSPIKGFMNQDDFQSVVSRMRLRNGVVWSIPILLDIDKTKAKEIHIGKRIALRDKDQNLIAVLIVSDKYSLKNKEKTAKEIFKTSDTEHPGVHELLSMKETFIGGDILLIDNSKTPYEQFNLDPRETRVLFREKGWARIAGFQTRNAPHRAHEYLQKCALEQTDGLFINPVIGKKKKGDFTDEAIIKAYKTLIEHYFPKNRVVFSILPLKMRYAGPREAIFHAIIRKNFGCTHFVVGRDHAGVGDFYGPYEAQEIFDHLPDLDITILRFENAFYCEVIDSMATSKTTPSEEKFWVMPSGTLIREKIRNKDKLPEEMIRPEVLETLQKLKHVFVE